MVLTISQLLGENGFAQYTKDCCISGRYELVTQEAMNANPNWIVNENRKRQIAVVMFHVDDMLFTGAKSFCTLFLSCISFSCSHPRAILSHEIGLTFRGVDIQWRNDGAIELSQFPFYDKVPGIHGKDLIQKERFALSP